MPLFPRYKMALFRYFKCDSAATFLSDPKRPLSTSLSTGNIKAANKAVLGDGRSQKAHVFLKLLVSKIYSKANSIFFENLHFQKFSTIRYCQRVTKCGAPHYVEPN